MMNQPHEIRHEINKVPFGVYLTVTQERRWDDSQSGLRTPVPAGPPRIELMAGDGPEFLTVEDARRLRDALTEALEIAERLQLP